MPRQWVWATIRAPAGGGLVQEVEEVARRRVATRPNVIGTPVVGAQIAHTVERAAAHLGVGADMPPSAPSKMPRPDVP